MNEQHALARVEPALKYAQYWANLIMNTGTKTGVHYELLRYEELEDNKIRLEFRATPADGIPKDHFILVSANGFCSIGSFSETEEGERVEDKLNFKNMVGTLCFNAFYLFNKLKGNV